MAFRLRIGSRPSQLAVAQTTTIKNQLEAMVREEFGAPAAITPAAAAKRGDAACH